MNLSLLAASSSSRRATLVSLFSVLSLALASCIDEVPERPVVAAAPTERVAATQAQAVTSGTLQYGVAAMTFADSFAPAVNQGQSQMKVGAAGVSHSYATTIGLVRFTTPTNYANSTISNAWITVDIAVPSRASNPAMYPSTYGANPTILLQRITSNWADTTATWNTFPSRAGASASGAVGLNISASFSSGTMLTDVRNWSTGTYLNYGYAFAPNNTGSSAQYSVRRLTGALLNVTYQCNSGYAWTGAGCSLIYCNSSWPTNGSYLNGYAYYGNTDTYYCNSGYALTGSAPTCGGSAIPGTWNSSQPTCTQISCTGSTPTNGSMSGSPTTWGNAISYACNAGYYVSGGSTSRTCSGTLNPGTLSGSQLTCAPIVCSTAAPTNGSVTATSAAYGGSVTYSCGAGYALTGTATATCGGTTAGGTWSTAAPTCVAIACTGTAPTNGSVSGSPAAYGGSISYACLAGYYVSSGNTSRTCGGTTNPGTLSGSQPVCSTIVCSTSAPTNGTVTATSANYGNSVTYGCNAGYALTGTATATCGGSGAGGTWSSVAPTCVAITCTGAAPTNGGMSGSPSAYNGAISYTCNAGYALTGSASRTCGGTTNPGTLSGSQPTCTQISCNATAPTNGSVSAATALYGTSVVYSCATGYALTGTAPTCGGTTNPGTWSGAQPTCTAITCSDTAPTNGAVSGTPSAYGGTISYSCNTGYYVTSGNTSRTCGGTLNPGTLSGSKPTCGQIACTATAPTNGSVSAGSAFYGASVVYSCNAGYAVTGTAPTCGGVTSPGTWSGAQPTCSAISCNATAPTNGTVSASSAAYGGMVTWSCNSGWEISAGVPSTPRTCGGVTNPGSWSSTPPAACININECVVSPTICGVGACSDSAGSYSCACPGGYNFDGTTCVVTNACLASTPCDSNATCTPIGTMSYSCACNTGYSGDGTTCAAVSSFCAAAPATVANASYAISGGVAGGSTQSYGATAAYTCGTGFTKSGVDSTCQANGTWSTAPSCVAVVSYCPAPPVVTNAGAAVVSGGVAGTTTNSYQATAAYTCDAGYTKSGPNSTCQSNGLWSTAPTCTPTTNFCGAPSTITNGSAPSVSGGAAGGSTNSLGATAAVSCNTGYSKSGSDQTCLASGSWSTAPSCVATTNFCAMSPPSVTNAATPVVSGGVAGGSTSSYQATAAYSCNTGYSKSGPDSTCQSSGIWSTAPTCVVIATFCAAAPPTVTHAGAPVISGGAALGATQSYGATASYTCDTGYSKSGVDSVCQANGSWSSGPSCVAISSFCASAPPTVANAGAPSITGGAAGGSTQSYGADATYTCNTGFALAGTASSCQADGTWSAAPLCNVIATFCASAPPVVVNAGAAVIGGGVGGGATQSYGAVAAYACDVGYMKAGMDASCQANGTWSAAPTCTVIASYCGAPPVVGNGSVTGVTGGAAGAGTSSLGATAAYDCATGYAKGGSDSTCQADTTWTTPPTCTPIVAFCPVATVVANAGSTIVSGGVAGGSTTSYGANAVYACNGGYAKSGGDATCQADGSWSTAPTCVEINECTDDIDNCSADAICTNTAGSFSCACNAGYLGDGVTCVDADECALDTDDCNANATCTNTVGSFSCACNAGYAGDGVTCDDVDECLIPEPNAVCSVYASCTNLVGSYGCICDTGFQGTGVFCLDVDDCAAGNVCGSNERCVNEIGPSHTCECLTGFTRPIGDPNGACTASCGNGVRGAGEDCDDANLVDGDGCSAACLIERGYACFEPPSAASDCVATCGDGLIDPPYEQCDDGASNSDTVAGACRVNCRTSGCGDGVVSGAEECDRGIDNSDTEADGCRTDCRNHFCGDGVVDYDSAEICDPGGDAVLDVGVCGDAACRLPDAGVDAGVAPLHVDSGCGCRVTPRSDATPAFVVMALFAGAVLVRRRRRSS